MATAPLRPLAPKEWDAQKAQHLLNRAGFGIPRERVAYMAQLGHRNSVESLIEYEKLPKYGLSPSFLIPNSDYAELQKVKDVLERREARTRLQRKERRAMNLLQQWWIERLTNSPRPLEEKMTLFWHGHFATSAQKVKRSLYNEDLNNTFRLYATGDFQELTRKVGQSPAMLIYLDNTRNVKGKPNENWARELMELFTLGIGSYTEEDIKESARSFTGWALNRSGEFQFNTRAYDTGSKTFLGKTGNFQGNDIIDIIFEQPAVSQFICTKLYKFFAHDEPDPAVIDVMAKVFRDNNYQVKPVLNALFMSEAFYRKKVMGSQIKSPTHFIIQLAHDMNIESPPYSTMTSATKQLGQDLFYPPNVKGWDGGRAWINANTLLTRYNLPVSIGKANGSLEMSLMESSMQPEMSIEKTIEAQREEFIALLQKLPEKQAQRYRTKMRSATSPAERQKIYLSLVTQYSKYDRWNVDRVFEEIKFTTAKECIDGLTARFLTQSLLPEQQELLAKALGAEAGLSSPLKKADVHTAEMNATLHLLLSTAEYQLC